jgi:hypothetical protein
MSSETQTHSESKAHVRRPNAALVARVIGGLLCLAAGLKIFELFDSYGEGIGWTFALIGASIELLVGAALVLRVWPSITVPAAAALFLLMATISLIGASRQAKRCGCLGPVPMPPWAMLVIDAVAAALLIRQMRPPGSWQNPRLLPEHAACLAAVLLGLPLGSILYKRSWPITTNLSEDVIRHARIFTIIPGQFEDRPFYLGPFIRIDADLSKGEWKVILTRPRCRKCDRMLRSGGCQPVGNERVAVVLVEEKKASNGTPWALPEGCQAVVGHLDPEKTWHFDPPMTFRLTDGKVTEMP